MYLYCCQLLSWSFPDLIFGIAYNCAAFSFTAKTWLLILVFALLMAAFSRSASRTSTAASPMLSGSSTPLLMQNFDLDFCNLWLSKLQFLPAVPPTAHKSIRSSFQSLPAASRILLLPRTYLLPLWNPARYPGRSPSLGTRSASC